VRVGGLEGLPARTSPLAGEKTAAVRSTEGLSMTDRHDAGNPRYLRPPLRIGVIFTLLVLGLNLGANLLIGGFDPQIHQLLLRGVTPESIVAPDEPAEFAEMPPPQNEADVAHMAFEVVLTDFFPQSIYNTVYVFLISLFVANAPLLVERERRLITWLAGLGGFTFASVFLITALLTPAYGPESHQLARAWLFPIPALMLAGSFTWTLFAFIGGLFAPRPERAA
jgi:hypothetical protein